MPTRRPGASCAQGTQRLGLTPTAPLTVPRAAGRLLERFPGRHHEVAGTPPERRTVVLNPKSPPSVSPPRPGERRCPSCATPIQSDLPFCGACGTRVAHLSPTACANCGRADPGGNRFCPSCGHPLADPTPKPLPAVRPVGGPARPVTLVILDRSAQETARYRLQGAITTLGRQGADLNFPDDAYLSPIHAQFVLMDGTLLVRDLGSRNGTWVYLEHPHRLSDGDLVLIGSQILRYRRLGYPGPRPPGGRTRPGAWAASPRSADIANLAQIRADGSVRDMMHLSPGRTLRIGREQGDWQFPYDPSMSALHASVRSEDADFVLADEGSRNGIAMAVRGEYALCRQDPSARGRPVDPGGVRVKVCTVLRHRVSRRRPVLPAGRHTAAGQRSDRRPGGPGHRRALPHQEEAGRRRDGAGLSRRACEDGAALRHQDHERGDDRTTPTRSAASTARPPTPAASPTPTSARSTTSARPATGSSTSRWSSSRGGA